MTNEELIKEFGRWVGACRPDVWVKYTDGIWKRKARPYWSNDASYVIDDRHAELRMLQIDKPDTKFEMYSELSNKWVEAKEPKWLIESKYRVSQCLEVDTKVIVWDNEDEEKSKRYFSHFKDGIIYCFGAGTTEWSSDNGSTTFWDNWELADV